MTNDEIRILTPKIASRKNSNPKLQIENPQSDLVNFWVQLRIRPVELAESAFRSCE